MKSHSKFIFLAFRAKQMLEFFKDPINDLCTRCPLLTRTLVMERNMILNNNAWETLTYFLIWIYNNRTQTRLMGELAGILWLHSKSDKSMEIEQCYAIKFFIDEGMKPLDILICLHKYYSPRAFNRSILYFWIGETRRAEQTSQKFQDPAGPRMKIWRPSSPEDMNKISICPAESRRNPYGSRSRRYAIICSTSWDWNASDHVGSHTRWRSTKKLNVHNMLKRCCRFLLRMNRQDFISDIQVTNPGCFSPITNG
jgi:hypothetical protein